MVPVSLPPSEPPPVAPVAASLLYPSRASSQLVSTDGHRELHSHVTASRPSPVTCAPPGVPDGRRGWVSSLWVSRPIRGRAPPLLFSPQKSHFLLLLSTLSCSPASKPPSRDI
ncbi:hypothetical protein I3843_15G060000 [Carya illinoinensis]|nr:hypothetical protein I3843_15G060000 [Carya illinoinensis]